MAKPKKLDRYPEQDYPSLAEFTDRRGFLKRIMLGALAVGAGSQLATGCVNFPQDDIAGGMRPPDYFDVRLPAEGFASAYLNEGDYLTFAATLITYDEAVADHLRASPEDGVGVLSAALVSTSCGQVTDPDQRTALEQALAQALQESLAQQFANPAIAELTLLVDVCEDGMIAGGEPVPPDYP